MVQKKLSIRYITFTSAEYVQNQQKVFRFVRGSGSKLIPVSGNMVSSQQAFTNHLLLLFLLIVVRKIVVRIKLTINLVGLFTTLLANRL